MGKKSSAGVRLSPQQLELVAKEEDAPLPSADELAKLHSFRPDLVDVAVKESREEIAHRRKQEIKVSLYVFIERMAGLIIATLLTGASLWVSYLLAMSNHDVAAGVIFSGTLASIIAAILKKNKFVLINDTYLPVS